MTDHDALLAAVLADPAADLPRLVYADYLEEFGHPALAARAHFIRHQIEADRLPNPSPERTAHERAAAELFALHRAGWGAGLPVWVSTNGIELHWRRGFIDELVSGPEMVFERTDQLIGLAPVTAIHVRGRIVAHVSPTAREQGGRELTQISSLRIGPGYACTAYEVEQGRDGMLPAGVMFSMARRLPELRSLSLSGNWIDDGWMVYFVTMMTNLAFAPVLNNLDLSDNPITDAGAHTLATARGLDELARLDLTRTRIIPGGPGDLLLRRRFGDRVVL